MGIFKILESAANSAFYKLPKTTRNIFGALIDICAVLAEWHETAYSQWYEKYITSMAELYKKIRTLLDEDNGVRTPTNMNASVCNYSTRSSSTVILTVRSR